MDQTSPLTAERDTERAMSRENVEIVRKVYESWNRGDLGAAAELFDDHVVVRPFEAERAIYGKAAMGSFFEDYAETVGHDTEIEDLVDAGGSVVLRLQAHLAGDQSGMEADLRFSHVVTLRKGKVVLSEYFWDHREALEAAGLQE
jgi:ketosteroid isomerase-like protein